MACVWRDHRALGSLSLGQMAGGVRAEREDGAQLGRSPAPPTLSRSPGGSEDAPLFPHRGKPGRCQEVVGGRSSALACLSHFLRLHPREVACHWDNPSDSKRDCKVQEGGFITVWDQGRGG